MAKPVKTGPQGGKAATRAKNTYNGDNYDRLYPYVRIGSKAVYEAAAEVGGYNSINEFLEKTLNNRSVELLGEERVEKIREEAAEEIREKRRKKDASVPDVGV